MEIFTRGRYNVEMLQLQARTQEILGTADMKRSVHFLRQLHHCAHIDTHITDRAKMQINLSDSNKLNSKSRLTEK